MKQYQKRVTTQVGMEAQSLEQIKKIATELKIGHGWLMMQMTEMFIDNPSVLFNHLAQKTKPRRP